MNDNYPFEQIERYLFDEMSATERQRFEGEITASADLKEQVELHKLEHESMRLLDRAHLKSQFDEWDKEVEEVATQQQENTAKVVSLKRRNRFRMLAIAASFALALSAGLFSYTQTNYSNEALADNYFSPTSTTDRSNIDDNNPLTSIFDYLANEEYDLAIEDAESLKNTPYEEQALLLQAEAQLLKKDYSSAVATYDFLLISAEEITSKEKAEWNKSLALLYNDEKSATQALLSTIANNDEHLYQEEASSLLTKLDSFWHMVSL